MRQMSQTVRLALYDLNDKLQEYQNNTFFLFHVSGFCQNVSKPWLIDLLLVKAPDNHGLPVHRMKDNLFPVTSSKLKAILLQWPCKAHSHSHNITLLPESRYSLLVIWKMAMFSIGNRECMDFIECNERSWNSEDIVSGNSVFWSDWMAKMRFCDICYLLCVY